MSKKKEAKKVAKKATKKVVAKQPEKRVTKATATKDQFECRQVGKKVILKFKGKTYSRNWENKSELDSIIKEIQAYNKRNSSLKEAKIIAWFEEPKEKKKIEAKGLKKAIQKEAKQETNIIKSKMDIIKELADRKASEGLTEEENVELKKLIDKMTKVEEISAPIAPVSPVRRSGEY